MAAAASTVSSRAWPTLSSFRRLAVAVVCLTAAATVWLSSVHLLFTPSERDYTGAGVSPLARALSERHLRLWTDPNLRAAELQQMRRSNAEWDFMGRTFLVLALGNMALREPANRDRYLEVMDRILAETLRLERERGKYFFLMNYAHASAWRAHPERSLFLDGEIALMLAVRRLVQERPDYAPLLRARVDGMISQMEQSRVLSGESYPDECWTFCNSVALAAIRISDVLDNRDHRKFLQRWVKTAQKQLTDERTGLLVSSYEVDGNPNDGPEGSSIWMVAHCLQVVDPEYAADQYWRARRLLHREVAGFGYAAEWPKSWRGPEDVDSGPVIPGLDLSPGSSGLAVLGAASFGDRTYLRSLLATLNLAAFPVRHGGSLRYAASNQVGDAVLLYALVQGPAWRRVTELAHAKGNGSRLAAM